MRLQRRGAPFIQRKKSRTHFWIRLSGFLLTADGCREAA